MTDRLDPERRHLLGAAAYSVAALAVPSGQWWTDMARRGGARIETGVEALRVVTDGARVAGVETSDGRIAAPTVVIAAGAWSTPLLTPLGLDVPLAPHRIQVTIFRWPPGLTRRHPAVIDAVHQAWFRPEGRASTLIGVELGSAHADPEKFHEAVDESYVAGCRAALAARWPLFGGALMRGGWAGMIMMSEDGRPIIDQFPSVPGLYGMLGDSGTSFKTSPAIGRCLAEWIAQLVQLKAVAVTASKTGQPQASWTSVASFGATVNDVLVVENAVAHHEIVDHGFVFGARPAALAGSAFGLFGHGVSSLLEQQIGAR